MDDDFAKNALKHPLKIADVSALDYNAVFYPDGHGPMFDSANDEASGKLIFKTPLLPIKLNLLK